MWEVGKSNYVQFIFRKYSLLIKRPSHPKNLVRLGTTNYMFKDLYQKLFQENIPNITGIHV